jgi:hypothetical protein
MQRDVFPEFDREAIPEARSVERVERMCLEPRKLTEVDTTHALADAAFMRDEVGIDGALVAGIRAGKMAFLLIDTRDSSNYFMPFLLTTDDYRHGESSGYKGVYGHEVVTIGREHYQNRFHYDKMMSRDHFSVIYNEEAGKLFIRDEASTNGTYLTGFTPDANGQGVSVKGISDEMTLQVVAELEHERNYGDKDAEAPHGRHRNHPIIGRLSPSVRNGVYGTRSSEFVLVDDKSRLLKQVVNDFVATLPSHDDAVTLNTNLLLQKASFRVANVLRYDLDAVERLSEPHYGNKGLIDLSEYVEAGVGVCRHQALLAAHLIEEMIDRGYLAGQVGVERNYDREANGAHAWAVFKSEVSEDVIVDPANHFVGSRKKAQQEGRWRYVVANDDDKG